MDPTTNAARTLPDLARLLGRWSRHDDPDAPAQVSCALLSRWSRLLGRDGVPSLAPLRSEFAALAAPATDAAGRPRVVCVYPETFARWSAAIRSALISALADDAGSALYVPDARTP